jgi:hypothetical protein
MTYDAELDANNETLESIFLKLKEILASKLGSEVSIKVLTNSQADANKLKAFVSMSGCQTTLDKKDECYIIHITGSPCCA